MSKLLIGFASIFVHSYLLFVYFVIFPIHNFFDQQVRYLFPTKIANSYYYYRNVFGTILYCDTEGPLYRLNCRPLPEADKTTFQVLPVQNTGNKKISSDYAKDENTVYYREKILPGTNASSFHALTFEFATDGRIYFLDGVPLHEFIENRFGSSYSFNPDSIEVLSYNSKKYYLILKHKTEYFYVPASRDPDSRENIKRISTEDVDSFLSTGTPFR